MWWDKLQNIQKHEKWLAKNDDTWKYKYEIM